jgi:hypothetical protein
MTSENIFSLLTEHENQPVAFYTSEHRYSKTTDVKSIFDENIERDGMVNGGYEHHSTLRALAKKEGVEIIDKGWRFMILQYRKPMTYFVVNDNRGKNQNMLPHEAFSVVKMIGKQVIWEEHHYSQDEAQRAAELHISQKS